MKIVADRSRPKKVIKIVEAKYLKDLVLRITFTDGSEQAVDFKKFLHTATHPDIKKYLKESNFKKYKIDAGNLNWNDYDLIFPVEHLYRGDINLKDKNH